MRKPPIITITLPALESILSSLKGLHERITEMEHNQRDVISCVRGVLSEWREENKGGLSAIHHNILVMLNEQEIMKMELEKFKIKTENQESKS